MIREDWRFLSIHFCRGAFVDHIVVLVCGLRLEFIEQLLFPFHAKSLILIRLFFFFDQTVVVAFHLLLSHPKEIDFEHGHLRLFAFLCRCLFADGKVRPTRFLPIQPVT